MQHPRLKKTDKEIPGSHFGAETGRMCWIGRQGDVNTRDLKVECDLISQGKTCTLLI